MMAGLVKNDKCGEGGPWSPPTKGERRLEKGAPRVERLFRAVRVQEDIKCAIHGKRGLVIQ